MRRELGEDSRERPVVALQRRVRLLELGQGIAEIPFHQYVVGRHQHVRLVVGEGVEVRAQDRERVLDVGVEAIAGLRLGRQRVVSGAEGSRHWLQSRGGAGSALGQVSPRCPEDCGRSDFGRSLGELRLVRQRVAEVGHRRIVHDPSLSASTTATVRVVHADALVEAGV
jgi:hypothetical protein